MRTLPRQLTLIVGLSSAVPAGSLARAQTARSGESPCLCGNVVDKAGNPVADVELELIATDASANVRSHARTGGNGSFSLKVPVTGSGELRVRRLGYVPRSIGLLFDTLARSRRVTITVESAPLELAPVKVEAPASVHMLEFNERRKQRGTGHFIDRAQIERRRPAYTSDLLRSLPGMSVRLSSRAGGVVRTRGCRPAIFIDGIQAVGAELDDVTRPSDIDGIEIYTSRSSIPPQFSGRHGNLCGAIIVWTRIQ